MEDKFEQLLRNELSEEEASKLMQIIENDSLLKKEFREYRDAWDLVKVIERRKLKEKVSQIRGQTSAKKSKKWVWYAAASVLVLSFSYWFIQQDVSGEELAQTYFEPYPDKFTSMGANTESLSKAMAAYNQGEYEKAESLFKQLPEEQINKVELYRGICLYQMDEKAKAKVLFKKLKNENEFQEPALWYLSLTHLALNEKDSAIAVLNNINNNPFFSFHKEDAQEILKELQ